MKQPEHVELKARGRRSLPLIFLPICVICLLLLGSQLLVGNGLMPQAAIARGVNRQAHSPKVSKVPGHAHHLTGKKQRLARHAAKHGKLQHQHTKKQKKQKKHTTAGEPTATVTATATPSGPAPDLYIRQLRMGESHLDVGKKLTYVLFSGNTVGAASVHKQDSIVIMDVVPLGLTGLNVQGKHWKISLSDTVSPAVLTATYDGSYPVNADTVLPPIFFAGMVTADAEPSITNTATIDAPGDTNPLDSLATDTVFVGTNPPSTFVAVDDSSAGTPAAPTSSATPSLTAVATVDLAATPTASMTAMATPSMTAAATAVMAATPTISVTATPAMTVTPTPSPTSPVTATPTPSPTSPVTATPAPSPTSPVVTTPISAPGTGVTATSTASATPSTRPDLTISISRPGAPADNTYTVGQRVSYVLQINNTQGPENQIVTVFDIAAVGISNVTFNAPGWTISASNTIGPVALSGNFNGPYPIAAGTSLPPITISGILTSASGPLFSDAAAVTSSDDQNSASNISVASITVQSAGLPTATATLIPTAASTTTPTAVSTVTPTLVNEVTPTATEVTTATSTAIPVATPSPSSTSAATATTTLNQSIAAKSAAKTKSGISLAIVNSNLYGNYALVHGQVKLALVVAKTGNASAVVHPGAVVVDEVIPLGLSHIQAQGKNWRITLSDTISPAVIHAQYMGKPALEPDMALPPISITGELNEEAVPILTSTAAASVSGISDSDNIIASDTLLVRNASQQAR